MWSGFWKFVKFCLFSFWYDFSDCRDFTKIGTGNQEIKIDIGSFTIKNSSSVKLLGITIDSKLCFFPHILNICGKTIAKIKALTRIRTCFGSDTSRLVVFFTYHGPI